MSRKVSIHRRDKIDEILSLARRGDARSIRDSRDYLESLEIIWRRFCT